MSIRKAWKIFLQANLNLHDHPVEQAQLVPHFTSEAQWLRNRFKRHRWPKNPIQAACLGSLGISNMLNPLLQSQALDHKLHK